MKKLLLLIMLIFFLTQMHAQSTSQLVDEQKRIVAELSGHIALKSGVKLLARSTKEERSTSRQYLCKTISDLGLTPRVHKYRMPNVNPIADLLFAPYKGANVYTILPATIPSDEYIILGAHFDTERACPGAIDNATGIVICYGALKMLSKLTERNYNLMLVYFDQEEEDLTGSQAFVRKLKRDKTRVHSVHSFDTMGWDRDGDRAVELGMPTAYLESVYDEVAQQVGICAITTQVGSSDHEPFIRKGYNAVGITDELTTGDYAPYKDTPKDTYETVNFDFVTSTTVLIYEVIKKIIQE